MKGMMMNGCDEHMTTAEPGCHNCFHRLMGHLDGSKGEVKRLNLQLSKERERCAKIASEEPKKCQNPIDDYSKGYLDGSLATAGAIRRRILSDEENRKCPSTYTHSSLGKLACEKDEAHLHRRGDVEHQGSGVKWMSV